VSKKLRSADPLDVMKRLVERMNNALMISNGEITNYGQKRYLFWLADADAKEWNITPMEKYMVEHMIIYLHFDDDVVFGMSDS
jgi:hypothetical protein